MSAVDAPRRCAIVVVGKLALGSRGLCVFGSSEGRICEGSGRLREWQAICSAASSVRCAPPAQITQPDFLVIVVRGISAKYSGGLWS